MYSLRVSSELGERLDAEFYNPLALETIEKINQRGTAIKLGNLISEGYRVVYHGTDTITGLTDEKLLPFLSPTKIDDQGAIDFGSVDKLPIYYKEQYPKGLAKAGELLIEVKGNVSKVGIVPQEFPNNLMISGSLYKAALDDEYDPHYVLAFLKTRHGQTLKDRLTSNTIINYIAKDELYSIPVLIVDRATQKYIGDKVRQAERLRIWAKKLLAEARLQLNQLLLRSAPHSIAELNASEMSKLSVRIRSSEIEDRLDAWFYKTEFTKFARVFEELESSGVIYREIKDIATVEYGFMPLEDYWEPNKGHPFLRTTNIEDQLKVSDRDIKYVNPVESKGDKYRLREDDVLIVQLGNSTGRVAYISKKYAGWAYPSFSLRVRIISELFDPAFVSLFLSEKLGQNQISRTISITSVRPNTTKPAIESICIPQFAPEDQSVIGGLVISATRAHELSTSLLLTAKQFVESLIEGEIKESHLITAQQALESGDNSLDRNILSRLKTEGLDGKGDPLFPDLDHLYDLLEQADEALAE